MNKRSSELICPLVAYVIIIIMEVGIKSEITQELYKL